jgi:hypothetical protein
MHSERRIREAPALSLFREGNGGQFRKRENQSREPEM